MSETVDGLLLKLGLDSAELQAGIARANVQLQKFGNDATKNFKAVNEAVITNVASIAKWGAALSAAAAVGLGAVVSRSVEAGSALNKMAGQLGIATDTFRALTDSAEDFGVEQEKLTKSFLMLESRLVDASQGAQNIADEFQAAGLSLEQFASQGNEQRLYAIANAVAGAGSATERAQIAQAAFGQQGIKMVEWLRQGEAAIKGQVAEFGNLHGAIDRLDFARIHEAKKALGDVKDVFESIGFAITSGLTPAILAATEAMFGAIKAQGGFNGLRQSVESLSVQFAELAGDATQGFSVIYHEFMELVAGLGVGGWQIVKGLSVAWDTIAEIASRAFKLVVEYFKLVPKEFEVLGASIAVAWEFYTGKILQATEYVVTETGKALRKIGLDALAADAEEAGAAVREKLGARTAEATSRMAEATGALATQIKAVGEAASGMLAPIDVDTSYYDDMIQGGRDIADAHRAAADAIYAEVQANNSLGESWAANVEAQAEALDAKLEQKQTAADAELEIERNTEAMRIGLAQMGAQGRVDADTAATNSRLTNSQFFSDQDRAIEQSNARLWEASWRGKMDVMGSFLGQMAVLMQSGNKQMFEVGKAAAIGETVINTYKSATAAYSSMAGIPFVGPVLGAAAAGAAVVAGMANVQRIKSTSFGGSGSAGGYNYGGGAPSVSSAGANVGSPSQGAQAPRQTDVNVTLVGDRFSPSQVRGLISQINDATDDNVTLRTN